MKKLALILLPLLLLGSSCDTTTISTHPTQIPVVQTQQEQPVSSDFKSRTLQDLLEQAQKDTTATFDAAPNGYYENTYGNQVPRPYKAPAIPAGASARCRDGSYSFSQSRRGTCSHHGGVSVWY